MTLSEASHKPLGASALPSVTTSIAHWWSRALIRHLHPQAVASDLDLKLQLSHACIPGPFPSPLLGHGVTLRFCL